MCTAGKFTAGIVGTVGKFTAGINDTSGHTFPEIQRSMYSDCNITGGKFATGVREFKKKIEKAHPGKSGDRRKMIREIT